MKNNYYDIKRRNSRKQKKLKKHLQKHMPRINRLTPEERKESNYRKRKAKKLNYKKVFLALIIFILLIYLIFSVFSKLLSKIKKPNNSNTNTTPAIAVQKDITINMAVVRRYYVSFN